MANNTSGGNRINVPQAKGALDNMKYEIARELGVNLKQGYNGDLTSREAGYVGRKFQSILTLFNCYAVTALYTSL